MWVEFFRRGDRGRARGLRDLILRDEAVMCGPVAAELLKGVEPSQHAELWTTLVGLEWRDLNREDWRRTGEVASELRRRGESLPLTDVAIATTAARAGAAVWTADSDFERIAKVLKGLEIRRLSPDHGK